ncbi:MAG: DUF6268 family outer membrane beta-barrel protein [Cyclobacteriaceae bacterium]
MKEVRKYPSRLLFGLLLMTFGYTALTQDVVGIAVGYEYFPSAELVTPLPDAPGLEIETSSKYISAAFPLSFQEGKITILNSLNYKKVSFSYENHPINSPVIDQAQYVDYSFFMIDSLNARWKLAAMINPIIASDFESSLSKDDFIVGGILGLIRTVNVKLDWGFGLAYMSDFGTPIPLPFIYLDWRPTPKVIVKGIIPSNLLVGRKMTNWFDLGMELAVDGNRFHGSPTKFGNARPFMRYSEGTLSALSRFHFAEWLHLNIYTGWGFFRNFEFYEGNDQVRSFDLKKVSYFSTQVVFGV